MPIEAEDLYRAAQALDRMKPPLVSDEICARTMINRMYYAAYLATREAVRAQFGNPSFDVAHRTLAETLEASADPDVSEIGSRLRILKAVREDADYRLYMRVTRFLASLHLADARFVLENAMRLKGRFPLIRARRRT